MRPRAGERARPTSRPRLPSRGRTRWLASTYLCLGSPRAGCAGPHADGTRRLHPPPANSLCLCQRDGQIDRQAGGRTDRRQGRTLRRSTMRVMLPPRAQPRSVSHTPHHTTPPRNGHKRSRPAPAQGLLPYRTVVPSRLQSNLTVSRRVDSGRNMCFKIIHNFNCHSGLPPRPVSKK